MSSFDLSSIIAKKKRALQEQAGTAPETPTKRQKKYKSRREIEEEKRAAVRTSIRTESSHHD